MPRNRQGAQAAPPRTKPQSGTKGGAKVEQHQVEVLAPLPRLGAPENRRSKDELNLIEYPWAALWQHEDATTVISHEWDVPDLTIPGKMVRAAWQVAGHPKLGLPTAGDLRLYLVLMELTREQNLAQVVTFTRYDLLKRLGAVDNQRRYDALRQSFQRLKSVTISADNAFRDARTGVLKDVTFSIIDNVEIVKAPRGRKAAVGAEPPPSFFRWNDVIYNSLQHGYLATLDLDFALSLRSDVALSLYRLLSKKAHGNRSTFEMSLSEFYHRHLGLRPTPYPSKMKERLKTGHDELLDRGFLRQVLYAPMKTRKSEKIIYIFPPNSACLPLDEVGHDPQALLKGPTSPVDAFPARKATQLSLDLSEAPVEARTEAAVGEGAAAALIERVTALGVALPAAQLLARAVARDTLELQLDCLAERHPKDPAATLIAAVRGQWKPPAAYLALKESEAQAQGAQASRKRKATRERELAQAQAERVDAEHAENQALDARFHALPHSAREEIEAEVSEHMKLLVQHLSADAARGGWEAMRRQAMREHDKRDELERNDVEGPHASSAEQSARTRLLLSNDGELDAFWKEIDEPQRATAEAQVRERMRVAGMDHFKPNHPGWQGVRRTILREMLRGGLLPVLPGEPNS